ncbi:MFS transporter [Urbifossiella limnaea]|uniref:Niacin/nicotinamide transporter NaiP n=1 Tax=Urbifossiella limnaea TaxID=2528023 RepID=A0A517XZC5_9BACT|nr:MFS transporter [Urbifossiella limnaea]QDU22833.1 Putative niacin/nicotinamide transporter NaiP [Urbifossiella limnaea]
MSHTAPTRTGWASLRDLNGYQWFVFIVCCLAWDMDCMDQQLFALARRPAMVELVPQVTAADPRVAALKTDLERKAAEQGKKAPTTEDARTAVHDADIGSAAGWATTWFLVGWAVGGIGFGILGDRWGRVKTLMATILLYALFTGLSSLSQSVWDFHAYRLLTGLGVGGVFAAAVTLLAETMPDHARPFVIGLFQASSVLGNCSAALLSIGFGKMVLDGTFDGQTWFGFPLSPWRLMFLVGIIPGLLVVVIQARLKEPEKWTQAMAAGGVKKAGSYTELLGDKRWRANAVFGLILALSGVIGLWGIGFFSYDLQQYVFKPVYAAEADALVQAGELEAARRGAYIQWQTTLWAGLTSLLQNTGAFFGMLTFSYIAFRSGRRPAFAVAFVIAAASTALVFGVLSERWHIFVLIPLMGFCLLSLFGGYAIYFPELFPTRLRSTGTSFCYNVGRLLSAPGPAMLGFLTSTVFASYPAPLPLRYAGMAMCSIFALGLCVLPFLPETKDRPLPE